MLVVFRVVVVLWVWIKSFFVYDYFDCLGVCFGNSTCCVEVSVCVRCAFQWVFFNSMGLLFFVVSGFNLSMCKLSVFF